jgi:hypothetical protein
MLVILILASRGGQPLSTAKAAQGKKNYNR